MPKPPEGLSVSDRHFSEETKRLLLKLFVIAILIGAPVAVVLELVSHEAPSDPWNIRIVKHPATAISNPTDQVERVFALNQQVSDVILAEPTLGPAFQLAFDTWLVTISRQRQLWVQNSALSELQLVIVHDEYISNDAEMLGEGFDFSLPMSGLVISPDQTWIAGYGQQPAHTKQRDLMLVNLETHQEITVPADFPYLKPYGWSPTANQLLYIETRGSDQAVFVYNVAEQSQNQLTPWADTAVISYRWLDDTHVAVAQMIDHSLDMLVRIFNAQNHQQLGYVVVPTFAELNPVATLNADAGQDFSLEVWAKDADAHHYRENSCVVDISISADQVQTKDC